MRAEENIQALLADVKLCLDTHVWLLLIIQKATFPAWIMNINASEGLVYNKSSRANPF